MKGHSALRAARRQAQRALRTSPGFTVVALAMLALGIGATTAIFSVADAVVLRGLPFDQANRLVAVGERSTPGPGGGPQKVKGLRAGFPTPGVDTHSIGAPLDRRG
jgi:hypothetical protein